MNAPINKSETVNERRTAQTLREPQGVDQDLEKAVKRRLRLQPLWNPEAGRQG